MEPGAARQRLAQAPSAGRRRPFGIARHPHSRVRVPLVEERHRVDVVGGLRVENAEDRPAAVDEGGVSGSRGGHEHGHRDGAALKAARVSRAREGDGAKAGERGDPQHRGRAVGPVEDDDQQHAAQRRAGEVRGVEPADAAREPGQRQAHGDPAQDERHRDHGIRQHDGVDRDHRRMQLEGDAQLRHEAEDQRDGEQHRGRRQPLVDARGRKRARRQIDEERARRHAEHRHRQRDERKVVQHRHAEDPRQQDLVHQRGEGDEEQADVGRRAGLGGQAVRSYRDR